jgi:hypothetical protein
MRAGHNISLQRTSSRRLAAAELKSFGRPMTAVWAGVIYLAATANTARPCSRAGEIDPKADVRGADLIVVAAASKYVHEPEGDAQKGNALRGGIEFEVIRVVKGDDVPDAVTLPGYLCECDDFNDQPVPYHFVRPSGRAGSCYSDKYKKDGLFLIFLKRQGSGFTVDWDALAPLNEQLHSLDDPWIGWVSAEVEKGAK